MRFGDDAFDQGKALIAASVAAGPGRQAGAPAQTGREPGGGGRTGRRDEDRVVTRHRADRRFGRLAIEGRGEQRRVPGGGPHHDQRIGPVDSHGMTAEQAIQFVLVVLFVRGR